MGQPVTMSMDVDPMIQRSKDHVISSGTDLASSTVKFSVKKDLATSLEKQCHEKDEGIDPTENRMTSDIQTETSRYVYKVGETLKFQGSTDSTGKLTPMEGDGITCSMDCRSIQEKSFERIL